MRYREPDRSDWTKGIIFVAVYTVGMSVGAFVLLPLGRVGVFLWAVVVGGGLFALVRWHAQNTAFRCASCGHEFEVSALTELMSPHGLNWHYLKCPHCDRRTRAKVLVKDSRSTPADSGNRY